MDPRQHDEKDRPVKAFWDQIADGVGSIALALVMSVGTLAGWVVRTVLTDRARVDKLEASLRDMKTDMDGSLDDLKTDIRQLTGHLLGGKK